jgi:hypothetical protein
LGCAGAESVHDQVQKVRTQAREAEIAQFVHPMAPALCMRIVDLGWDVPVFEALEGRQADYAPGSDDLRHTADLLARIGEISCPKVTLRQDAGSGRQ